MIGAFHLLQQQIRRGMARRRAAAMAAEDEAEKKAVEKFWQGDQWTPEQVATFARRDR